MKPDGVETLKAVARRSVWIIVLCVAVGVVAMNLIRHSQGPQYAATSKVVLSPTDLASALSGVSSFVDPTTLDATEQALASSRQLFQAVATNTHGVLGSADSLSGATSVTKSGGTVTFSVTGSEPHKVVAVANAIALAYPKWRADVSGAAIGQAINQVQAQLNSSTRPDPSLSDQLNRLRVLKTLTSGNVLLVDTAESAAKTRPRPVRDSLLGGLIGLFIALIIVAIREAVETRVRQEGEVEELLNVPVVGSVEVLPRRTSIVTGRGSERYQDMYALLAANITQLNKDAGAVIAVTSATAEEGKTTTAGNVAAALARRNSNVVLVDLDTRKGSLSKVFKIPPGAPGIDEVLNGDAESEEALWTISLNGFGVEASPAPQPPKVHISTATSNGHNHNGQLRVLPMGPAGDESVAKHSRRLESVLEELSQQADYVIVDTPPALAVPNMTEIARLVDVVLIVVRHGRVSRRSLMALTRLQRNWTNASQAAVLVGTPAHQEAYTYYGKGIAP